MHTVVGKMRKRTREAYCVASAFSYSSVNVNVLLINIRQAEKREKTRVARVSILHNNSI